MNWDLFNQFPLVGIMRRFADEDVLDIVNTSLEAGLTNIEVTMDTENAVEQIKLIKEVVAGKMNVGAGTVCTLFDLEKALQAGAEFIVTPVTNPEVVKECKKRSVPICSGAFSPTEVYQAWELGADIVKVFPCDVLGAKYIKGLKGPLNHIKLMPTGGVSVDTIAEFKAAGASAYGAGGSLFNKQKIKDKDWDWLKDQIVKFKVELEK